MRNVLLSEKELEYINRIAEKKPAKRDYNQTYIKRSLLEKIDNLPDIIKQFVEDLSLLQMFALSQEKTKYRLPHIEYEDGEKMDLRELLIMYSIYNMLVDLEIVKKVESYPNYAKVKAYNKFKSEMKKNDIVKLTPQILSEISGNSPKKTSRYLNLGVKIGLLKKVKKGEYELIPP